MAKKDVGDQQYDGTSLDQVPVQPLSKEAAAQLEKDRELERSEARKFSGEADE